MVDPLYNSSGGPTDLGFCRKFVEHVHEYPLPLQRVWDGVLLGGDLVGSGDAGRSGPYLRSFNLGASRSPFRISRRVNKVLVVDLLLRVRFRCGDAWNGVEVQRRTVSPQCLNRHARHRSVTT
jgi:hypothetical protein